MRLHRLRLLSLIITLSLILPNSILAQNSLEPGQDPFALSPELLQHFQGTSDSDSQLNTIFNGDGMKNQGLFTNPSTQLGGAAPLTAPIRDNQDDDAGPSFILITSQYQPSGDLTSQSQIKITVNLKNVGENTIKDLTFSARLENSNATLIPQIDPDAAPTPVTDTDPSLDSQPQAQPPSPSLDSSSDLDDPEVGLIWTKDQANQNITLTKDQSITITWYVQANQDDSILRWTFTAKFGAGQSYLLQWIPIKNPNPTGILAPGQGTPGIPSTCASVGNQTAAPAFPKDASFEQAAAMFKERWNINFVNSGINWGAPEYQPFFEGFWDAIASVECTSFIENVTKNGPLSLIASYEPSYWGWQRSENEILFNLSNMLNQGALGNTPASFHQFVIHELTHVFMSKNYDTYQQFENTICGRGSPNAHVSIYGGTNCHEDFAEGSGYYAARGSHEQGVGGGFCPSKNPYDWGQRLYYDFYKANLYDNVEFGTPAPSTPTSC